MVKNDPSILTKKLKGGRETALHIVVEQDNVKMLKFVVEEMVEGKLSINEKDNIYGDTPLHAAVMVENVEFVRLLVNSGASISEKDKEGKTPLDVANALLEDDDVKLKEIQNILGSRHFREQDQNT